MASTKPRFGGGINMESTENFKTTVGGGIFSTMANSDNVEIESSIVPEVHTTELPSITVCKQLQELSVSQSCDVKQKFESPILDNGCNASSENDKEDADNCFRPLLCTKLKSIASGCSGGTTYGNDAIEKLERKCDDKSASKESIGEMISFLPEHDRQRLNQLQDVFTILNIEREPRKYTRLETPNTTRTNHQGVIDDNQCKLPIQHQENPSTSFSNSPENDVDNVIYCKNLFLKDKKKQFYIIICEESCMIDLKQLKTQLNVTRNLTFAQNDDLHDILQVKPGEVTPFAVMQKSAENVKIIFHESLSFVQNSLDDLFLAFHPFSHLLQVNITFLEFVRFLAHFNKNIEILGNKLFDPSKEEKKKRNPQLLVGERKGKLKSYVKKHVRTETCLENKNVAEDQSDADTNKQHDENVNSEKFDLVNEGCKHTTSKAEEISVNANNRTVDLGKISSETMLPEVGKFYSDLTEQQTIYREVDVSQVTSRDIGPSLGVKCFMLKDRRENYFLVISHEFYELDYGRLKKSLQPRKKLDTCDENDLLLVLGVDWEHFTPFAAMNQRAKHNEIKIFFTEKIASQDVILCIQHPFAQGLRLIMNSSELQRLLASSLRTGYIGIVEEKIWHRRYDIPFTQFQRQSQKDGFENQGQSNMLTTQNRMIKQDLEKTEKQIECKTTAESDDATLLLETNENRNGSAKRSHFSFDASIWSQCHDMFLRAFDLAFAFLTRNSISEDSTVGNITSNRESPVDGVDFFEKTNKMSTLGSSNMIQPTLENFEFKSVSEKNQQIVQSFELVEKSQVSNTFHEQEVLDVTFESKISVVEWKDISLDHLLTAESTNKSYKNKKSHIGISEIEKHLNENNMRFIIDNNKDENKDDEKDTTSQICSTMYMTDESFTHYLVVGREEEHVGVKRFRRRFQIRKKLFLIDDISHNDGFGHFVSLKCNPFEIVLSTLKSNENKNVQNNVLSPKFKMVLFSSIYMDPEMTCLFILDKSGTTLRISAQELEKYAKKIGMEVWYMP